MNGPTHNIMSGFSALIDSLAATAPPEQLLLVILAGTALGLIAGLMPGVSGRTGLVLVTPLAIGMGPIAGAVFLVAFHSVIHTSGSVPAILLGTPTSAAEAATVIDGYAMTRKGEGARAIGASLAASAIGGVIGAVLLLMLAPAALSAVQHIGAPESAALSIFGLMSIAALSSGGMAGGVAGGVLTACIGILLAAVGLDGFSETGRFTFDIVELTDGINVATLVTGLFVVPELLVRRTAALGIESADIGKASVLRGFRETLRYRWLLLRTSLLGAVVGLVPGLGASVAVWLAYGHARQSHPSATPYGEGAIEGVIAPEAANNSKEGGSLVPTLFFGIPGSSGMGILLASFMLIGVEVGPRMLNNQPEFIYLMGLTNIVSNLIAVPICLLVLPLMARIALIRQELVAPVALAAAIAATWMTEPIGFTLLSILVLSALGLLLKLANLPRAPLLLGFVLGPAMEMGILRSSIIHGFGALSRPGVLLIAGIALICALPAVIRHFDRRCSPSAPPPPADTSALLLPTVILLSLTMSAAAIGLRDVAPLSRLIPGSAIAVGLGAALIVLVQAIRQRASDRPSSLPDYQLLALAIALVAGIWLIGAPAAAGLFVIASLLLLARLRPIIAVPVGLSVGIIVYLLETLAR